MTLGSFHSSTPGLADRALDPFFYNRSLQQEGLELRLGDYVDDIRYDMRLVGSAIIRQQEKAAEKHRSAARATTDAVRAQTTEIAGMRRDQAAQAARVVSAIEDSAEVVRAGLDATQQSIASMRSEMTDQFTHVRWALAQQSDLLRDILGVLRENRKNECRQLIEQGVLNLQNGYVAEAKERLEAALAYDNTDHELHQQLGFLFVRLKDLDSALAHFRKALVFLPKVSPAQRRKQEFALAQAATHVARTHYARGEYPEAAEHLEKALAADATNAKNWYDLGVMYAYTGEADRGARAVATAAGLQPFYFGRAFADSELDAIRPAVERALTDTATRIAADFETTARAARASIADVLGAVERLGLGPLRLPTIDEVDALVRTDGSAVAMDAARRNLEQLERETREKVAKALPPAIEGAKKEHEQAKKLFGDRWSRDEYAIRHELYEMNAFERFFFRGRVKELRAKLERFGDTYATYAKAEGAACQGTFQRVKALEAYNSELRDWLRERQARARRA